MPLRQLGSTQIKISPIGLGCWQFSGGGARAGWYWGRVEQSAVNEIVRVSLENGVNWFDTAEAYGMGLSEQALAAGLQAAGVKPGNALIATKWLPFGCFASSLLDNIEVRLRKLSPYPVDLLQIHQPTSFSSVESQMKAMARLIKTGRIRSAGVSNFNLNQMQRASKSLAGEGFPLASNQVRFSLLDRRIEKNGVLAYAREQGITIIAYSPLAQGLLTGRFHDQPGQVQALSGLRKMLPGFSLANLNRTQPLVDELKTIAVRHKVTPAQVALAWVIQFHGDTVVAIPGASRPAQALQNAEAMKITLSAQELAILDQVSRAVGEK
jgi:aryl-alcohol dehydrogenase-like predicted oxidoreductase